MGVAAAPLEASGKTVRDYERLPRRRAAFLAGAAAGSSASSALARPPRFGAASLLSPPLGVYLNDTFTLARYATILPSTMCTSRSLTSAMRKSRNDSDACFTAAATAFSQDVLLV